MLSFIDGSALLEHHADLLFKTVCKLPNLCQLLTTEIVQTAEGGNTVIILSVVHFFKPDLHHAAIGRTAAEHKGLVHKLPEGFQTGRRQGHLQRHELTAAEQVEHTHVFTCFPVSFCGRAELV